MFTNVIVNLTVRPVEVVEISKINISKAQNYFVKMFKNSGSAFKICSFFKTVIGPILILVFHLHFSFFIYFSRRSKKADFSLRKDPLQLTPYCTMGVFYKES